MKRLHVHYVLVLGFVLLLTSCQQVIGTCSPETETVSMDVDSLARNENKPVQFPVKEYVIGNFNVRDSSGVFTNKYHAAEDYHLPAGTPVYAISEGNISFSGPMAGYGWLIIIDHLQVNVYSLYGHLSPSRWKKEAGSVEKGELIAYLGDSDENGSSAKYGTIAPHLHFGVRLGQRVDYPRIGDNRWQAGWTKACPEIIGWLKPSQFITNYAEGSFTSSNNPYKIKTTMYLSYIFGGMWIAGLGCIMLLGILMSRQLKNRNVLVTGLVKSVMPWMSIGQYKRVMLRETGKPGSLYQSFLVCLYLTSLAAMGFIITIMILG